MGCRSAAAIRPVSNGAGFLLRVLLMGIGALGAGGADAVRIYDIKPEPVPKRQQDGYYASLGVGFVNLDQRGVGVRMPLGLNQLGIAAHIIIAMAGGFVIVVHHVTQPAVEKIKSAVGGPMRLG